MTALLETRRPASDQYHAPRRAMVTSYGIHTAESVLDQVGSDTGAEGVAEFIANRGDPGSYHDVGDSDSAVAVVPPQWEAFHCRGGPNRWSLSYSFACRTTDWVRMAPERRAGFLTVGARRVVDRIEWIETQAGWNRGRFPIRRITKAQAEAGVGGFFAHADMDPTRRTDPGLEFPWSEFLALVGEEYDRRHNEGDDEMAKTWSLNDLGATLDNVGAFYERDAVKHLPPDTDWRAVDFRTTVLAGRDAWHDEVVKTLKAGQDPIKLLEFVEWALANPEAAAKL